MKADLNIHSRFSDKAPEWLFRRAGLAESYSKPIEIYDTLRARGMDLVTITDHNTIEGCLAIADRPGVFISEEVTAHFPADRCPVHILVWGITEQQHLAIQEFRRNIFDLQKYLAESAIAHAVAHPLYRLDDKYSIEHIEQLILLFQHFEGINGLRDRLLSDVASWLLGGLSKETIERLAAKHRITPTHEEPWRKVLIAGSDDRGGLYGGRAYTEVQSGSDANDFLEAIRQGNCSTHGAAGSPIRVAHGFYNNLRQFAAERFTGAETTSLVGKAFSRFMEGQDPTEFSWTDKLAFVAHGIATGRIFDLAKPANASLWKQFAATFGNDELKQVLARETEGITEPERRAFVIANFFANQLAFRFFTSFIRQVSSGNIVEAIQELSTLLPVLAPLAPYVFAFKSQTPDRRWLERLCTTIAGDRPIQLKNRKRAWFTDTLEDVNGVANTIRRLTHACASEEMDLTVVTSRAETHITDIPLKNFRPIGEFELPEYELQKLSFPPILQILDYIHREGFTEIIISTPGPVGLTALLAARLFGIRSSGIYHTDFPQYVRILTEDSQLETLTWNFMRWFYDQLDLFYVNSEAYREAWVNRGFDPRKIAILPRGLDTVLFNRDRRDPQFWTKRGIPNGKLVLLYVGRVSKEKDLDVIVAMWNRIGHDKAALAFVGDGPYRSELQQLLPDAVFTGILAGLDLAQAFASADIFVFPSTTDTFGNVVLEALASGLPNVVSDRGGPKDLIQHGQTGFVTRALDREDFARHVSILIEDGELRGRMSIAARKAVETRDWREAGKQFWALSPE